MQRYLANEPDPPLESHRPKFNHEIKTIAIIQNLTVTDHNAYYYYC